MKCRPGIASLSLGRAWVHNLDQKLRQARASGFEGVEVFYEDLEYLAKTYGVETGQESESVRVEELLRAAEQIRQLCDELGLEIVSLQPFMSYDGLVDRAEHAAKIEILKVWFRIAKVLRTDIIQVPSNFQRVDSISGDRDLIVSDLVEMADMGAKEDPPVRFAYENIAWGTFIDTWETAWEVIERVNRPNFGYCLDTFHIAGRVWADPASPSGKTPNADADLSASLHRLAQTIDVGKIFYVQLADAEKMVPELSSAHPFHVDGQLPRMSWSRNARLFPYEVDRGAYMPVVEIVKVVLKELKFEGWISMELFSRSLAEADSSVPEAHATRGMKAWKRLIQDLKV
jgi:4-hydroxyphenylpyruvate dioxygenase